MSDSRFLRKEYEQLRITNPGFIDMNQNLVINMQDCVNWQDGVNKEYLYKFFQIGDMKYSAVQSDNNAWLICDGRSLSTTVYSELYNAIGSAFGSNGAGTFKIPDCRGRVLGSVGSGSGLTARTIGSNVGHETETLTTNELPSHRHTGTVDANGLHNHGGQTGAAGNAVNSGDVEPSILQSTNVSTQGGSHVHSISNDGNHQHTFTSDYTGSGNAFSLFQPTLFGGNLFIFTNVWSV